MRSIRGTMLGLVRVVRSVISVTCVEGEWRARSVARQWLYSFGLAGVVLGSLTAFGDVRTPAQQEEEKARAGSDQSSGEDVRLPDFSPLFTEWTAKKYGITDPCSEKWVDIVADDGDDAPN